MKKITERYKLKGVYGPLFELFECVSDSYWTAVEVTAGQRCIFNCGHLVLLFSSTNP